MNAAPIFFLDRCLGRAVADALEAAGAKIERHDAHFPPDAQDAVWIPHAAAAGWVVLTKDERIRRNALEADAVVRSSARVVILSAGNLTAARTASLFVQNLHRISAFAAATEPPFIALLGSDGRLRRVK